jgi:hypothetical protein
MKKQTLQEQVSRIKGMMGKITNESFDTQIQPEELSYNDEEEKGLKVGDTVSDPVDLGNGPEFDGKILAIFPNLVSAEGQPGYKSYVKWMQDYPQYADQHDVNGKWYLVEWRTEGIGIYSEKDMENVIIAPEERNYDDYEEDEYGDDDRNTGIRYKWDWKDRDGESY